MEDSRKSTVSFGGYVWHLSIIVFSSTFVLGLILGVSFLVIGETSMNFEVGLDFSKIDGLWMMLGIPILSVLIFVVLSPLSFFIYRLLRASFLKAEG